MQTNPLSFASPYLKMAIHRPMHLFPRQQGLSPTTSDGGIKNLSSYDLGMQGISTVCISVVSNRLATSCSARWDVLSRLSRGCSFWKEFSAFSSSV